MKTTKETLEAMVDGSNVATILEMLSDICSEKSQHIRNANVMGQHIREVRQDDGLAQQWQCAGLTIRAAKTGLPKVPGIYS